MIRLRTMRWLLLSLIWVTAEANAQISPVAGNLGSVLTIATDPNIAKAYQNIPYANGAITVAGGSVPYTVTFISSFPIGLSLSGCVSFTSGCVISGTPTGTGGSSFTLKVTDSKGATASVPTAITVASVLSIAAPTPAAPSIAQGATRQFQAVISWSDGTTSPITNCAFTPCIGVTGSTWASSATSIATINNSGLATALSVNGTTNITATFNTVPSLATMLTVTGGGGGTVVVTTTALPVNSGGTSNSQVNIQTPQYQFLATGGTPCLTAQQYTWDVTVGAPPVGKSISLAGFYSGIPTGATATFTIRARALDCTGTPIAGQSGTQSITDTVATLSSDAVTVLPTTIAQGGTSQASCRATYNDASTSVCPPGTAALPVVLHVWNNEDESGGTATTITVAVGSAAGSGIEVCHRQGSNSTDTVIISDSASQAYTQTASGYVTNGTGRRGSCWLKANSAALTSVTATGSGAEAFRSVIVLEMGNLNATALEDNAASVNSSAASAGSGLVSGALTTVNATDMLTYWVGLGGSQSSWTAGTGYTIPNNNAATGANGSNTRTAIQTQVVTSIQTGITTSMNWGTSISGTGLGIFVPLKGLVTSGTAWDTTACTNGSGNTVASVNGSGLVTALQPGTCSIRATVAGISATATLTVTAPTLTGLTVTPVNPSTNQNGSITFTATGNDGVNYTGSAGWASSNTSFVTMAGNVATCITSLSNVSVTISATLGAIVGTTSMTCNPPVSTGIFCGATNFGVALPNCDPTNPTANTVYDTTMPNTSAYTTVVVGAGGDLQTAINNASCSPNGTIITLNAGSTYNSGFGSPVFGAGPYQLPAKTCAAGQWIIIQSSALASLPASGTRVDPTVAANMPKIQSVGGLPAIMIQQNANHYRFIGVEFNIPTATDTVNLIDLDATDNGAVSTVGTDFIFDRCYVHGNADGAAHNYRRGFIANTRRFAALDSYINQFHDNGSDSQAIIAYAQNGPIKIINNYLSGSGENIMFGGVPTNVTAQDVEIRHNHFFKPTVWRGGPIPQIVTKNLFEIKNARRVLLDGNVFENTWQSAQQFALVWTTSAGDSGPNADLADITFTHNIVRHAPNGMQIATNGGGTGPSRMLFQNNLFQDISSSTWGDSTNGWYAEHGILGTRTFVHDHNTILETGPSFSSPHAFFSSGFSGVVFVWQYTNNLVNHGTSGIADLDRGLSEGNPIINSYTDAATRVWNQNVFINAASLASIYPSGTLWATPDSTAVGFTDNTNCVGGTFTASACQLLATSAYHNIGTDGKDLGADINSITTATAGVVQVHD